MALDDKKIEELELIANELRELVIEALLEAKSGHTAGPLGEGQARIESAARSKRSTDSIGL